MILIDNLPLSHQNNKSKQFNLRALTVWAEEDYFYLEPNYQKSLIPTILIIDRKTTQIRQINSEEFVVPKNATPYFFSFFMGIIDLNGKKIIFLAEQAQLTCTINQRDIFRITKPVFLFYRPQHKSQLQPSEAKLLVNFVVIFEQGMYFSFSYHLTQPLHSVRKRVKSDSKSGFNWIQNLQTELVKFDKMWSLPVIQGFVNKIQVHISAQKLKLILISRRSLTRGGPLQYTVGIDQQGNVANYVETQFLFSINDLIFSFIQVRGSVPIFWDQIYSYGMATSIKFYQSIENNFNSFEAHMQKILKEKSYKKIVFLNLLNSNSVTQAKLIQNYQYLIKKMENKRGDFCYYYFDMHRNCENKQYKAFNNFLLQKSLKSSLKSCGFTALQMKQDGNYEILCVQEGVFRVNCSSCIDRTNIAQSRIAALHIINLLKHIDVKIDDFGENLSFVDNEEPFAKLYRNLWADNGDNLSKQYTGTQSTQSFALRQGKLSYMTSFDHGLTSLSRALRNIRQQDQQKSKAVEFIMNPPSSKKNNYSSMGIFHL